MSFKHAALAATALTVLSGTSMASAEIPEEVTIGGVFDVTGMWHIGGNMSRAAAQHAVDDFNAYLEDLGAEWRMAMAVEDSQALGPVAFEKVQTLNERGIDMLVGMAFSSHLHQSAEYVESNDMLVISQGSNAADLEMDDNMFRLVPSDSNQAPVIAAMLEDAGIRVLVPFIRDDIWGNSILDDVESSFNGTIPAVFKYAPGATGFSAEVSMLDERIGELVSEHGAHKVAVLFAGADAFMDVIDEMISYSQVDDVRWFSTDTQSTRESFFRNEDAAEFVDTVMLTMAKIDLRANHITVHVDGILNATSENPSSQYVYAAYDSVWLLGTAILQTGTTDVTTLVNAIPLVAERMIGAAGLLALDGHGDLAHAEYSILQASGGEFVPIYEYDPVTGMLVDIDS